MELSSIHLSLSAWEPFVDKSMLYKVCKSDKSNDHMITTLESRLLVAHLRDVKPSLIPNKDATVDYIAGKSLNQLQNALQMPTIRLPSELLQLIENDSRIDGWDQLCQLRPPEINSECSINLEFSETGGNCVDGSVKRPKLTLSAYDYRTEESSNNDNQLQSDLSESSSTHILFHNHNQVSPVLVPQLNNLMIPPLSPLIHSSEDIRTPQCVTPSDIGSNAQNNSVFNWDLTK